MEKSTRRARSGVIVIAASARSQSAGRPLTSVEKNGSLTKRTLGTPSRLASARARSISSPFASTTVRPRTAPTCKPVTGIETPTTSSSGFCVGGGAAAAAGSASASASNAVVAAALIESSRAR